MGGAEPQMSNLTRSVKSKMTLRELFLDRS